MAKLSKFLMQFMSGVILFCSVAALQPYARNVWLIHAVVGVACVAALANDELFNAVGNAFDLDNAETYAVLYLTILADVIGSVAHFMLMGAINL